MKLSTSVRHTMSKQSEEMITSFLDNHSQGTLATLTKSGAIQSSIINVFDLTGYRYAFMTKKNTRKYKNLSDNPAVSFISFDSFSRTEVEIEGITEPIDDEAERAEIIAIIEKEAARGRRHVSPYVTSQDDAALFVIYPYKIHLTTYWDKGTGPEAYHEAIEFDVSKT